MIYLASPYTNFHGGHDQAYLWACAASAYLFDKGELCFSPIAHCHPIAERMDSTPRTIEQWIRFNTRMLEHFDGMKILTLDGWEESRGIKFETEAMILSGKILTYLAPIDIPARYLDDIHT